MPSARIFNSLDQPIPQLVETPISYDSVAWDTGGFYNPATPTRLTAPLDGLYTVGACQHVSFPHGPGHRIHIRCNGGNAILQHGHRSVWPDQAGSTTSLHTIIPLREGDFLQVTVYHWAAGPRNVASLADYSPHFWLAYLAPYPE